MADVDPPASPGAKGETKVGWIAILIGVALALAFGGYMGWLSYRATREAQDALMRGTGP